MFQVGDRLCNQRYAVLTPLGQGGFSQTFEVDDAGTIKVLKALSENYPKAVDLFQREFKVLSQLRHPGIPLVESDGYFTVMPAVEKDSSSDAPGEPCHCLIMERVPGVDLREWLKQQDHHPLRQDRALEWLNQLAEILVQLHHQNCFHRDIKPSNIMLRPDGQLVLIDFGAVREITETFLHKQEDDVTSTHLYSRGYTPMEQMQGRSVPQSDFFALGRSFVHLLTGANPLDFSTDFETGDLLWREHAPHVSVVLADLIDRLMAPFVAKRPASADHLLAEIVAVRKAVARNESPLLGELETVGALDRGSSQFNPYGAQNHTTAPSIITEQPLDMDWTEMPLDLLTTSLPGPVDRNSAQRLSYSTESENDATVKQSDSLQGVEVERSLSPTTTPAFRSTRQKLTTAGLCSLVATAGVMGMRLLGLLQGVELAVFDRMMRSRFAEPLDDRLVLVTVDDEAIAYQDEQGFDRQGSLADEALAKLLTKLAPHSPRVIGIDIYNDAGSKDNSGNPSSETVGSKGSFRDVLRQSDRLVAVCEVGGGQQQLSAIAPPAEVPLEQVGFSNMPYDGDQRVRRQLLGMSPDEVCNTDQSLSAQLVARYLTPENLDSGLDDKGVVYLGDRFLTPIAGRIGGYQHPSIVDEGNGYQLLLNYRANPNLAPSYGLATILSGALDDQLSDIIAERVVLVGTTERSYKDYHLTPYGDLAGVVIQGHMTSQILSAVLDDRPLLWGWPVWGDGLWVLGWASLVGGMIVMVRSPWLKVGVGIVGIISLTGLSFILLLYGGWMPLVPPVGAIALTGLGLKYKA
ncbi:MAG: CHASE2 domain-containing protein [Cyanobacteria bacterium P01_F01_bin.150]